MIRTAALAALIAAAPPAAAQSWKVGNDSYHVYFNGLDLNSAQGRAAALARVERAAARLCDDRRVAIARRACIDAIVADAAKRPGSDRIALALAERTRWGAR